MNEIENSISELKERIAFSTSPFHTVSFVKQELQQSGFEECDLTKPWNLQAGKKYYIEPYKATIFAFTLGEQISQKRNLRMAAAHTDFPCFRIKPNCVINENGYQKLNVEVYGGPILNTWLDRPLSIAGKVVLKSDNVFAPRVELVDLRKPLLLIPNLAIHMNKEVNKGVELNRQKDILPFIELMGEDKTLKDANVLLELLSKELNVGKEEILDFELYVYQTEEGQCIGATDAIFSAPRLDNITSVQACVKAVKNSIRNDGINLIALFDHEEIGSRTKQGAGSILLYSCLEKIYASLGFSKEDMIGDMLAGFLLSIDVAHCLHPNMAEKNDPTHKVMPNKGVVLKVAANQSYASDSEAIGIIMQIGNKFDIPYQKFVNRSDGTSGSTLGSISSTLIPMRTMDVGVPLLAMHSARESMGTKDQYYMEQMVEKFFDC